MVRTRPARLLVGLLAGLAAFGLLAGAVPAQTPPPAPGASGVPAPSGRAAGGDAGRRTDAPGAEEAGRLPVDSITRHDLDLPGRRLRFAATAGSIA